MRNTAIPCLASVLFACTPSVAQLTLDPTAVTLSDSATIKATPKDKDGNVVAANAPQIVWTSANPGVATVDATGKITAVKSGTTEVTAKVGEASATAKVTVAIPAKLTLDPATAEVVGAGKTVKLNAKVEDDAGGEIPAPSLTWTSSDPKIATVADGVVTAVGVGQATVAAASGAAKGEARITVKAPEPAVIVIDPPNYTFAKAGGAPMHFNAIVRDQSGAAIEGLTVTWSASNEKIAKVSPSGDVTPVKKGNAKVTAKVGAQSADAEIHVK